MREWIIPCKLSKYDITGAFREFSRIDWKQSTNVEIGDIVFIYVAKPVSAILFKCRVNAVELPAIEIDDSAYVVDGSPYVNYGRHMELERIESYDRNTFPWKLLKAAGMTGTIQGPRTVPPAVSDLLNS